MSNTAPTISAVLGWGYFLAWSISFWPQVILNFRRKSVEGLSLDFLAYNVIGFSCYAAYTLSFFLSTSVQSQFKLRNQGRENLIAPNDVFFAVHAWVFTVLTAAQALHYRKRDQTLSKVALVFSHYAPCHRGLLHLGGRGSECAGTRLAVFLGTCKLITSLIKYLPQVYVPQLRTKSTQGWSIHNILLDATGGILSLSQLLLDAWIAANAVGDTTAWAARALAGNATKLGLAVLSLAFDSVFLVQHFGLYRGQQSQVVVSEVEKGVVLGRASWVGMGN
ncbi:PQ loop repeat-domain-containing protein [Catenaria anguillulae PL171]|uniref:PQ loop repeat-domain-containing protein n=1 Tax=Catenaria anguillulae PL171 TaxID=765915 RepID=A0A1Y2I7M4_9FUNG|nr:PQ loop repeat-domain-containing protein [Catenaria anguillulae PL171]